MIYLLFISLSISVSHVYVRFLFFQEVIPPVQTAPSSLFLLSISLFLRLFCLSTEAAATTATLRWRFRKFSLSLSHCHFLYCILQRVTHLVFYCALTLSLVFHSLLRHRLLMYVCVSVWVMRVLVCMCRDVTCSHVQTTETPTQCHSAYFLVLLVFNFFSFACMQNEQTHYFNSLSFFHFCLPSLCIPS